MSCKHSEMVKKQFEFESNSYDNEVRYIFPKYDEMCNIIVKKIKFKKKQINILDLGIGTGYITYKILTKFSKANVIAVDLSKKMIKKAEKRLTKYNNQIRYVETDMINYVPKEKFDLIISTLSIHHLTAKQKQKLYCKLHLSLNPKGLFIMGDMANGNTDKETKEIKSNFKKQIINVYGEKKGPKLYSLWNKEDLPESPSDQLLFLSKAGFRKAKCIWKKNNLVVIFAFK